MMDSDELDKKSSLNNAIRNVYQKITAGILKKYLSPTVQPEKISQYVLMVVFLCGHTGGMERSNHQKL